MNAVYDYARLRRLGLCHSKAAEISRIDTTNLLGELFATVIAVVGIPVALLFIGAALGA